MSAKFNHKVFNFELDGCEESTTGLPFREKLETWLGLGTSDWFTDQIGDGEEPAYETQDSWQDLKVRKIAVSNLLSSYVKKETLQFRTVLALRELIEDEDDV